MYMSCTFVLGPDCDNRSCDRSIGFLASPNVILVIMSLEFWESITIGSVGPPEMCLSSSTICNTLSCKSAGIVPTEGCKEHRSRWIGYWARLAKHCDRGVQRPMPCLVPASRKMTPSSISGCNILKTFTVCLHIMPSFAMGQSHWAHSESGEWMVQTLEWLLMDPI